MHFITYSAASALVLAGLATAQSSSFSVATPSSLQQCTPYAITWTGGSAPFTIQITQGGGVSDILETLATGLNAQSYTWAVNQPVGTRININIVDSTGANAPSAESPAIAAGTTSCLAAGSSSANAASSSTAASPVGTSSSVAAGSSSSVAMTSSSAPASTSATSSSSSAPAAGTSSTTSDGASSVRGYAAVAAGVVGIAAAALL